MNKLLSLLLCALCGVLLGLGSSVISSFNDYTNLVSDNKSLYNYKTTNLLSSGNEYKHTEQKQTLTWKIRQAKIEE